MYDAQRRGRCYVCCIPVFALLGGAAASPLILPLYLRRRRRLRVG